MLDPVFNRFPRHALAMAGLLLTLSCPSVLLAENGATTVSIGDYRHADFLSDYSRLQPQQGVADSKAEVYRNADADWSVYSKVLLEDIEVRYDLPEPVKSQAGAAHRQDGLADYQVQTEHRVTEKELDELKAYLQSAITRELGQDFTLVTEPGSDVLRLRIAITELEPTKTEVSLAVTAIPFGSALDMAVGDKGDFSYLGTAAIEAEYVDSRSNEQLAAYVEKRAGKKYNIDLEQGIDKAINNGLSSYLDSYSEWAYIEDALDHWAKALRISLDGKMPAKPVETVRSEAEGETSLF